MSEYFVIEKECKPCPVCNNTGWEIISTCNSESSTDPDELFKTWKKYYGDKTRIRIKKYR